MQYHEANSSDTRVLPAMMKLLQCVHKRLFKTPLGFSWAGMRWQDFVLSVHWMLEHNPGGQEQFLWDHAELWQQQGYNWKAFYADTGGDRFPKEAVTNARMHTHGVNNGQAIKSGAVW